MKPFLASVAAFAALTAASPAFAGGPTMAVGAAEDGVRASTVTEAKAQLDFLRLAGLNAVRVTSVWAPGETSPTESELTVFESLAGAGQLLGIKVVVQVMNAGSRTTPLTAQDRSDFSRFAAAIVQRVPAIRELIVGNEPNLNRFWLPQFGLDGSDVAADAYTSLLASVYDALKAESEDVIVLGGATSPRGEDNPRSTRHTHSPTAFITDMGAAYRKSGRTKPLMDGYAHHPYQDYSALPPSFAHPRTKTIALGDYDKLVKVLGTAFDGTAQPGSTLPIVYDEFGVETQIPSPVADLYTGREPTATRPVDEATQAAYYRQAFEITFCQPNVRGLYLFHTIDERDLDRWQSGVFYVNNAPKTSLEGTRAAARDTRGGVIKRCDGLQLTPAPKLDSVKRPTSGAGEYAVRVRCDIDCNYVVRLEKLPRHATVVEKRGRLQFDVPVRVSFGTRRLAKGQYRFTVRATAPVNVGDTGRANTGAFTLK